MQLSRTEASVRDTSQVLEKNKLSGSGCSNLDKQEAIAKKTFEMVGD